MERLGCRRHYNLVGGFKAWKADGLEVAAPYNDKNN